MNKNFAIAVHGGAGTISRETITPEKEKAYKDVLAEALEAGYSLLEKKGSALEAVAAAVVVLENCTLFNAGKGSVFTNDGKHEMDACIMRGDTLQAGAVAGVRNIKNPVVAARAVMERSEHVFLLGDGAEQFAREHDLQFMPDEYFFDHFRFEQLKNAQAERKTQLDHSAKKFGTVGAVALDLNGNLAAATSTGGMTNKKYMRIGDSPIVGAGTYANNETCAISCTGHGEYFIRSVTAYDVSCLMEYAGMNLETACKKVVNEKLVQLGGEGGLIAIDKYGNVALPFNSSGMYRACRKQNEAIYIAIYE